VVNAQLTRYPKRIVKIKIEIPRQVLFSSTWVDPGIIMDKNGKYLSIALIAVF